MYATHIDNAWHDNIIGRSLLLSSLPYCLLSLTISTVYKLIFCFHWDSTSEANIFVQIDFVSRWSDFLGYANFSFTTSVMMTVVNLRIHSPSSLINIAICSSPKPVIMVKLLLKVICCQKWRRRRGSQRRNCHWCSTTWKLIWRPDVTGAWIASRMIFCRCSVMCARSAGPIHRLVWYVGFLKIIVLNCNETNTS